MPFQASLVFNPTIKNAILKTLEADDVEAQKLFVVWLVMLKLDMDFENFF